MQFEIDQLPVVLPLGERIKLAKASGVRLHVLDGRVWVTQEGLPDDVFVDAGGDYEFASDGRTVISAEGRRDARIAFDVALSVTSRQRSLWAGLLRFGSLRIDPLAPPLHSGG